MYSLLDMRSPARTRRAPAPPTQPELRNRVREIRQELGLTQAELAEAAGVTRQTIIAIERGGYVPSAVLALHLARVLSEPFPTVFWLADAQGEPS